MIQILQLITSALSCTDTDLLLMHACFSSDTESARGANTTRAANLKNSLGRLTQVFKKPKKEQVILEYFVNTCGIHLLRLLLSHFICLSSMFIYSNTLFLLPQETKLENIGDDEKRSLTTDDPKKGSPIKEQNVDDKEVRIFPQPKTNMET